MNDFLEGYKNNNGANTPNFPDGLSVYPVGFYNTRYYSIVKCKKNILQYFSYGEWVDGIFQAQFFYEESAHNKLAELRSAESGKERVM